MIEGRIHSVETFGAVDGPGIRYVVFVQGCPMRCLYCHNPDSWDKNKGILTNSEEVVKEISEYYNFIKSGGVTISGGEPLMQPDFVADILKRVKELGLHTAVDTSGGVGIEKSKKVIDEADMLLLDIKTADDELSKELVGQGTKNSFDTLKYCEETSKDVWVRHVLVPELTLTQERLIALADFLKQFSCIKKVELLPFHKMGEYKWKSLGFDYKLYETQEPTKDEIQKAKNIFKEQGLSL